MILLLQPFSWEQKRHLNPCTGFVSLSDHPGDINWDWRLGLNPGHDPYYLCDVGKLPNNTNSDMSHLPYCQVGAGSSAGLGAGGLDFSPPVPPLALLGFLAAWGLGPRVSIPSNVGRSCMAFPNPFSEVTQHHFRYVLFVGRFTDPRRFEGRWLSFHVLVELLQSQCKKTTWLGNTVASVFGKCNLPPLLWDESFSLLFQKGYVGSLWSQACGIVEWVLDSVSLAPEHTLFTTNEHNSKHLLGCYCMLASLLSTFNILTHLTLLSNFCDGCYHYLHFIDGDTEARSCNEPCSGSYR